MKQDREETETEKNLSKKSKTKSKRKFFTLLELMIVIAIIAIIGGGIFWRLSRLVEVKQRMSDAALFQDVLLSSHMLAINTKSDFELAIQETDKRWAFSLRSLEEPGKQFGCGKISLLPLRFVPLVEDKESVTQVPPQRSFIVRFFSTGQVAPLGRFELGSQEIRLPAIFRQEEGVALGPLHPDDLPPQVQRFQKS